MKRDMQKDWELCEKATPGPWRWEVNSKCHQVDLISCRGWCDIVMDFVRWGMQSAQPRFTKEHDGLKILHNGKEFLKARKPPRQAA
jgi:hypothetical protein